MAWKRVAAPVRWIAGIVILFLLLLVCAGLFDWNIARPLVIRIASAKLERRVNIGGALRVHLFSRTPSVSIDDLSVANPSWVGGTMLTVRHMQLALELSQLLRGHVVLRTLELDQPQLSLLREEGGRANWEFGNAEGKQPTSQQPSRLPVVRHFVLRGGALNVDDAIRKLTFMGMVAANESAGRSDAEPFRLDGQGTLNKEPFKLAFEGSALLNIKLDQPYHFQVKVDAGPSNVSIDGSLAKPFDFGQLTADVDLEGQNLANLYYLTGLSLPLTPAYHLSVHVQRSGMHFALHQIVGTVGSSDLRGEASVDVAADGRPNLKGTLASKSLNLGDLGVAFGAGVAPQTDNSAAPQLPAPKKEPISPYLLPTFEFQFDRLAAMDAMVDFRADSVQAQTIPFKAVSFSIRLDHGVLSIDPLDFELPLGRLSGQLRLDTRGQTPAAMVDLHLSDVRLDQFKGKSAAQAPMTGVLQSRARLAGHGNSVHAIAADANGTITAVIPHGEIRKSLAELTGINVLTGLGLLISKDQQTAAIRCGVAEFQVKQGDAHADRILVDTQSVLITGSGHINLADEALDVDIAGKPKKLRIGRLRTPINIRGTLRHPSISISAADVIKQGGIAAAAGALLTPLAAIIAFVDPGLAKDQDCAALLNQVQTD